jgi:alkylation response protein AidB-like acyl-CoA dehydrogenase
MDLTPDPLLERLGRTLDTRLAAVSPEAPTALADELAVLRELEAPGYEAPVGAGGFDLGLSCGIVVCAALGRRALPDGYAGGALLMDALSAAGDPTGGVASIVAGECTATVAGLAAGGRGTARRTADGWTLGGTVTGVGGTACWLVALDCALDSSADGPGDGTVLVRLPAEVCAGRTVTAVDGTQTVELAGLTVGDSGAGAVVGRLGDGSPLTDPDGLLARARVRHAAYLLGLADGAHQHAVRHAGSRRQFGRPIVEFQAVGFPLAQAAIALSVLRLSVQRAAWLADDTAEASGPDHPTAPGDREAFELAAVDSLALAADTAVRTVRLAVQVYGARGMSPEESAVPTYFRAVRTAATLFGPPGTLWREAGLRRLHAAGSRAAGSRAAGSRAAGSRAAGSRAAGSRAAGVTSSGVTSGMGAGIPAGVGAAGKDG